MATKKDVTMGASQDVVKPVSSNFGDTQQNIASTSPTTQPTDYVNFNGQKIPKDQYNATHQDVKLNPDGSAVINGVPLTKEQYHATLLTSNMSGSSGGDATGNAQQFLPQNQLSAKDKLKQYQQQQNDILAQQIQNDATINPFVPTPTQESQQGTNFSDALSQGIKKGIGEGVAGASAGAIAGATAGLATGGALSAPGAGVGAIVGGVGGFAHGAWTGTFNDVSQQRSEGVAGAYAGYRASKQNMAIALNNINKGFGSVQDNANMYLRSLNEIRSAELTMEQYYKQNPSEWGQIGLAKQTTVRTFLSGVNENALYATIANRNPNAPIITYNDPTDNQQ